MSVKDALEGILYTTFIWCAPGAYAVALVYLGIVSASMGINGMVAIALGLSPVLIAWYRIRSKREKEEFQRLLKPSRYLTDEERHEAIDYLIEAKKQKA